MDINSGSFFEKLPDLIAIIACADYLVIDLEMSGVQVKDSLPRGAVSLEQVYGRIRTAASTFGALQLGVTAIRWTGSSFASPFCGFRILTRRRGVSTVVVHGSYHTHVSHADKGEHALS